MREPRRWAAIAAAYLVALSGTAIACHSVDAAGNASLPVNAWAWGDNSLGQLGAGNVGPNSFKPVPVDYSLGDKAIAAGQAFSLALSSATTVWAWGYGKDGQLGDGTTTYANGQNYSESPVLVSNLTGVTAIAAGALHALALTSSGTVSTWGYNGTGQLGIGTRTGPQTCNFSDPCSMVPVQVSNLSGVTAIGGGYYHSLAVRSDGSVWSWGYNNCGQLGDGTTIDRYAPVRVSNLSGAIAVAGGDETSLALKSDGTVWSWGGACSPSASPNSTVPVQVANLSDVTAIAASVMDDHYLAIKSDGTLWAWGNNSGGQLGNGSTTSSSVPVQVSNLSGVTAIAAGGGFSLAATSDGRTWAWGSSLDGALGCCGIGPVTTPGQVNNLYWVTALAAGSGHSLALAPPVTPQSAP